jgi:FAD/FMN-containing dehydrogenase
MSFDIAGLAADLGSIPTIADAGRLRNKSRDYYWYSPILRAQLEQVRADLVVLPETEDQIAHTLRACHARRIPVTVRGAGTGNYGQAMPLRGGVVLDLSQHDQILRIGRGFARAAAGVRLLDLDRAAQAHSGQEQRMHPSTLRNATLGGFICGGSGGVGSVTWGGLRDRGNVLGARVITMEAAPRILELRGDSVQKVVHAYGTTGVVTEVEIALTQAHDWIDVVVAFDDFATAARFAHALACQDALLKKLVTVIAAPIVQRFLRPIAALIGDRQHVVLAMIAGVALESFASLLKGWPGEIAYRGGGTGSSVAGNGGGGYDGGSGGGAGRGNDHGGGGAGIAADDRGDRSAETGTRGLLPIYEYAWNHTTLHALKVDRMITYHQILYPAPDHVQKAIAVHERLPDDVLHHLEFVRFDGQIACYGLPLIQFTTAARLREIEAIFETHGCPTFSPHTVTLEEGGMKRIDPVQLAFKHEADPLGLLNPGKMLAWEQPDYDASGDRVHLFPAAGTTGRAREPGP